MKIHSKIQNRFLKSFFLVGVLYIYTFTSPFIQWLEGAESQMDTPQASSQNEIGDKQTGGIIGDPSHHRGFDLGYDAGPRAGSEDKVQNKYPDPSVRPEYKKPGQFYRHEYGSRAAFIAGFRIGFMRGYKSAFTFSNSQKVQTEGVRISEPLQKIVSLAKDAL